MALFLDATKGLGNLTTPENTMMNNAIVATDATLTWTAIKAAAPSYDDTMNGTSGNDNLSSGAGNDTLNGLAGDDNLFGQDDDDTLNGWYDNDSLYGGAGNDGAYGWYGDDVYYYESGDDFYSELNAGGTDKIVLPAGITLGDLTFYQEAHYSQDGSLFIVVDGLGTIETPFFASIYGGVASSRIETIEFSNTSTVNWELVYVIYDLRNERL